MTWYPNCWAAANTLARVRGDTLAPAVKVRDTAERSLQKLVNVFGADAVWAFKPTREGNTVVLAQRTALHPTREQLAERAEAIQTRWGLPATKWARVFKPFQA